MKENFRVDMAIEGGDLTRIVLRKGDKTVVLTPEDYTLHGGTVELKKPPKDYFLEEQPPT